MARAPAPLPFPLVLTHKKGESAASGHQPFPQGTVTPEPLLGLGCACSPLSTTGVPSPILGGFEGRWGTGGILEQCHRGWVSAGQGRGGGAVTQAGLTPSDPRMSSAPGSSQGETPMHLGCC